MLAWPAVWIRVALSSVVLVALVAGLDLSEVRQALASAHGGYLAAAVLADLLVKAIMVRRWTTLLSSAAPSVTFWVAMRVFLVSSFVGIAMPIGGADVLRAYVLSRHSLDLGQAAASVVVDRVIGITALTLLGAVTAALGAFYWDFSGGVLTACGLGLTTLVLFALLLLRSPRYAVRAQSSQRFRPARRLLHVFDTAVAYFPPPRVFWLVFGLSLAAHLVRVLEIALVGASLGLGVGFQYYLAAMPTALLVLMLPVSVLGIGLPQGVIVWLLQPAGVPAVSSFALSALLVALAALGTLPGLYFCVRGTIFPTTQRPVW